MEDFDLLTLLNGFSNTIKTILQLSFLAFIKYALFIYYIVNYFELKRNNKNIRHIIPLNYSNV